MAPGDGMLFSCAHIHEGGSESGDSASSGGGAAHGAVNNMAMERPSHPYGTGGEWASSPFGGGAWW